MQSIRAVSMTREALRKTLIVRIQSLYLLALVAAD